MPKPPSPDVLTNILSLVSSPSYRARTKMENMKIKIWICPIFCRRDLEREQGRKWRTEPVKRTMLPRVVPVFLCVARCVSAVMKQLTLEQAGCFTLARKRKSVETSALSLISSYCVFCWRIVFYLSLWCVNALNGLHRTMCNSYLAVLWMVAEACPLFPSFWQLFPPLLLRWSWWPWVLGPFADVKRRSLKFFKMLEWFFRLFV